MKNRGLLAAFALTAAMATAQQKPADGREKSLEGVTITKTKKAVEQKADRTIFDFSEQPHLNTGSLMEGVKKLPGLIVSDVAGMMYQGKLLEVFMDGRPLGISGNQLQSFLDGMPANSVERVEIITQPGAEFPATSGGAIINIITNKNARNYLSASYNGQYSFSNYDKFRSRTNHSLLLNAKNKYFGWQLNVGENYREGFRESTVDNISNIYSDNVQRGYFAKAALTFDIGRDKLLLNYDLNHNNNDSYSHSTGIAPLDPQVPSVISYRTTDDGKSITWRHDANALYQVRFDDKAKKLDFNLNYNRLYSTYDQQSAYNTPLGLRQQSYGTVADQRTAQFKVDFSQPLNIFDGGKVSVGGLYEIVNFDTENGGVQNFDYQRQTTSSYAEVQATVKKVDLTLGARAEGYDIDGHYLSNTTGAKENIIPFRQYRIFPNASLQYNFMPRIYAALNYNQKIQLPSISSLNPNNTTYANANISFAGSPNLRPAIYNNFEVKISAFDYAFIGYNLSVIDNQNMQFATRRYFYPQQPVVDGAEAYGVGQTFVNIPSMRIHNINLGVPIPMDLFTKGIKEMLKFNFNPDKINFLYAYVGYQLHELPDYETKGFLVYNLMLQLILPKDIKLTANYMNMTLGNYYYYEMEKPWMNSFDITASKKFMDNRLTVSIFANDIFRTNQNAVRSMYQNANILLANRFDAQNFGITINYKLPTKNKLATENPILLNQNKPEDKPVITPVP